MGPASSSWDQSRQIPSQITIDHSAVTLGDTATPLSACAGISETTRIRKAGSTSPTLRIGVDRNGNIYELRDPEVVGDTATSYDPAGHLLVRCEGNFDKKWSRKIC
jgi:hypothetical protein